MRQRLFTYCLLCICTCLQAQYNPDILGGNYLYRSLSMPADYEGEVVCTLIKKPALPHVKQAVLYIHGYNDYFFQKELGDSIETHGYNFYALDLRKYGRSLRSHQDPFYCKNLREYFADIDTALQIIHGEGNTEIVLMAHSTGGLIAPLYLKEYRPPFVSGLILNSPFLDMNMSPWIEKILIPLLSFVGKFFPALTVQKNSYHSYAHSLLRDFRGEWSFNTHWKRIHAHPKKAGWIHAIHSGQQKIQKGLQLDLPLWVMSSDKSFPESDIWKEEYAYSDIVLDVNDIRRYSSSLGPQTTYQVIPGGKHDLILSQPAARAYSYQVIFNWLSIAFQRD